MNELARLTEPYLVYLALYDAEVTVPAGAEFELLVKHRGRFFGMYRHAEFGEIAIETTDAEILL